MNKHHQTDFKHLRIPQLEKIYNGVQHRKEELQKKMACDMGRSSYLDIHPRNYTIIPELKKCSLHDMQLLDELCEKEFNVYWTMEQKKAEESGTLEVYYATNKLYKFRNTVTDEEFRRFLIKADTYCNQRMNTHKCIQALMEYPNFIEEVNCL